jgi:hypothetical protein
MSQRVKPHTLQIVKMLVGLRSEVSWHSDLSFDRVARMKPGRGGDDSMPQKIR